MGKKKVAGGAGKVSTSVRTRDISHILDSQIAVGEHIVQIEKIENINVQGMSEKQVREIISSQLDPILKEIGRESTKMTQEQQMTYETIKKKVNEADRRFNESLVNLDTYLKLGNIEYDRQNYETAIEYFNKIIKIDIRNVSAWHSKGFALHNLKRYDKAIRCYDKILEIDPEHVSAWYTKGTALHSLGRYDEAIRCYDKTLEIEPEHAGAWSNKGFALHNLGRYSEAIRCYDKALEMEPEHVGMWYNKGLLLHTLGRYSEAIRCYDKVLEIDPNYKPAKKNREIAKRRISKII